MKSCLLRADDDTIRVVKVNQSDELKYVTLLGRVDVVHVIQLLIY